MRTIHEIWQLELLALSGMQDLKQFMIQYEVWIPIIYNNRYPHLYLLFLQKIYLTENLFY